MKTKEEILDKNYQSKKHWASVNREKVLAAMEEYAQQFANQSKWISVEERLPEDFNEEGRTKDYLVYIDNPFFKDGHYHVSYLEKSVFGSPRWRGIEPNVSRGTDFPNVTHWQPLPSPPTK